MNRNEVIVLSNLIYESLPFWKKRKVFKWYKSNNWDLTEVWIECVRQAIRMAEDREVLIKEPTNE